MRLITLKDSAPSSTLAPSSNVDSQRFGTSFLLGRHAQLWTGARGAAIENWRSDLDSPTC